MSVPVNPLALSDEEFLKLPIDNATPAAQADAGDQDPLEGQGTDADLTGQGDPDPVLDPIEDTDGASDQDGQGDAGAPGDGQPPLPTEGGEPKPEPGAGGEAPKATGDEAKGGAAKQDQANVSAEPDPEALKKFYAEMTAPLKAVGKTLEISSPEEFRRLAQLGANYGKHMQQLAPARKAALMLERAGLLGDEDKLALVISAATGDKQAIQKLLGDQKIDPLDLDVTAENTYTPTAYRVSDSEVRFNTVIEEVATLEHGPELIQEIDGTWDAASKEELFRNPEALEQLRVAKESGLLAAATAEVDRLKTVGTIPYDTPFIRAYVQVAPLVAQRLRDTAGAPAAATDPAGQPGFSQQVVGRRVAAPKPETTNGDRARAAATPRPVQSTPKTAAVNPLAMSDDEFMKQFGTLRL